MTVKGKKIEALGTNLLRNNLITLIGNGVGDFGYGQNTSIIQNVVGQPLKPKMFEDLKNYIQIVKNHQDGNNTPINSSALPIPVRNEVTEANVFDLYKAYIENRSINRLTAHNNSMTVYSNLHSSIRNSKWGPKQTITSEVDLLWSSEDEARHFFNSGGDVRMVLRQPNWTYITATHRNYWGRRSYTYRSGGYWWNYALPRLGTTIFSAYNTKVSGNQTGVNFTAATNTGFYNLTNSYKIILNAEDYYNPYAYLGSGYKDIDDVFIEARKVSRGIRFKITLREDNTQQVVDAGTRVIFSIRKATRYLTNPTIKTPQFITRKSF